VKKFLIAAFLGIFSQLAQAQTPQASAECKSPETYVIKDGDTLSKIAQAKYGTWRLYPFLFEANKGSVKDVDKIYVGRSLVIPCCVPQVELAKMRTLRPRPQQTQVVRVPQRRVVQQRVEVAQAAPQPAAPVVQIPAPTPQAAAPVTVNVAPVQQTVIVNQPPPPAAPVVQAPTQPLASAPQPPAPARQLVPPPPEVATPVYQARLTPSLAPSLTVFPGSAWNSTMTTPLEKGNVINYSHIDQGVTVWKSGGFQVQPYVALNTVSATKSYSWDNRVQAEGGLKLIQSFKSGLIDARIAYGYEARKHAGHKAEPLFAIDEWFGWGQPNSSKRHVFPGSTWATVGNISPFERGNIIGLGKIEQGVVVAKIGKVRVIPDAWVMAGFDTKKEFWNNRATVGAGLKLAVPWKVLAFDVTGGWERARQYHGVKPYQMPASGFVVKVNLWTGWRLHNRGGG